MLGDVFHHISLHSQNQSGSYVCLASYEKMWKKQFLAISTVIWLKEYWEQVRNKRWEKGGPFSACTLANLASITVITQRVSYLFCFHLSCILSFPLFSSYNVWLSVAAICLVLSEPRGAGTSEEASCYWLKSFCYTCELFIYWPLLQRSRGTPLELHISYSNARLGSRLIALQPKKSPAKTQISTVLLWWISRPPMDSGLHASFDL